MRLFVGNLEYSVKAEDLKRVITSMGYEVEEAVVIQDRDTGKSKGFGFVTLNTKATEETAIKDLDKFPLKDRDIAVKHANPQVKQARRYVDED